MAFATAMVQVHLTYNYFSSILCPFAWRSWSWHNVVVPLSHMAKAAGTLQEGEVVKRYATTCV